LLPNQESVKAHFLEYFASTLSNKHPNFNGDRRTRPQRTGQTDPDVLFWLTIGFTEQQADIFTIQENPPSTNIKGVIMKICTTISNNDIYIGYGKAVPLQVVVDSLKSTVLLGGDRPWLKSDNNLLWALNGSLDRIYRFVIEVKEHPGGYPIGFDESEFNVVSLSLFMKSLIQKLKSDSDGNMIRAARAESDRKPSDSVSVVYTTSDVSSILALSPFSLSGMKGMALLIRHPIIVPYGIYSYKNSVLLAFLNCFIELD
jgi:hypothetical protein